ncbi:MAG: hypothetical protein MMC23_005106 [Stictis urceolatum]|nr:hypothetical protein [Stictis urceolata]
MEKSNNSYYGGLEVDGREANGLQLSHGQELKEAIHHSGQEYLVNGKFLASSSGTATPYSTEKEFSYANAQWPNEQKSRKRLWMLVAAIAIIAIIIAVVVPVGVIISRQNKSSFNHDMSNNSTSSTGSASTSTQTSSPTSTPIPAKVPSSRMASTKGAFNGTGLTAIPPLHGTDLMWLFWQDYTGDLKISKMDSSSNWKEPESVGIKNAANGTALASLMHWSDSTLTTAIQHVIYTTSDNYLADVTLTNATGTWEDGGLYKIKSGVPGPHTPKHPSQLAFLSTPGPISYLYSPGPAGSLNELAYNINTKSWSQSYRFQNSNGYGGVAPQLTEDGTLTTLHMLTSDNNLRMWWRQTANSPAWNHGADANADVYPNSAMTAPVEGDDTDMVYYLSNEAEVTGASVTGSDASAQWAEQSSTGIQAMPGSSLFMMARSVPQGAGNFHSEFFWQKDGDDIQHYTGAKLNFIEAAEIPLS